MTRELLVPFRSRESYDTEDNCSGILYQLPVHCSNGEYCWRSNTVVRENDLDRIEDVLNPSYAEYQCECGERFVVFIQDK